MRNIIWSIFAIMVFAFASTAQAEMFDGDDIDFMRQNTAPLSYEMKFQSVTRAKRAACNVIYGHLRNAYREFRNAENDTVTGAKVETATVVTNLHSTFIASHCRTIDWYLLILQEDSDRIRR